jgi:cation diffusion facilitator family transporter
MGAGHGQGGEKTSVALSSAIASGVMTALKFAVGFATGSLGILSEATKSALDFVAAVVTWVAVRIADRPEDGRHQFGHGKVENISSLFATALLLGTGAWILIEAARRLLTPAPPPATPWYAVAILVLSIAVDFSRARALRRVAAATGSQALEADALHFASDMATSGAVLVGLGFVYAGYPLADTLAALGVAAFVCLSGLRLLWRTVEALIDTAPPGATDLITQVVGAEPGVLRLARLRARSSGGRLFADLALEVDPGLDLRAADAIRRRVEAAILAGLPGADLAIVLLPGDR